jgi:hypothetical protein
VNKSGLPVADIVARSTDVDIIGGIPPPQAIKHEEPTVHHENVDLLEEILQLKSTVEVLVEAVPLSENELTKMLMKGEMNRENI